MRDTLQKTPAKHSILRTIALQIMIVIATLVACEAILRVIDLRYLRTYRAGADRVYNYDAELGWFPYANSELTFTGIRTIKLRHNSLGLRDIEPETNGKPTIAFIGDSFVWGYDAEENERFTNLLRAKLPISASSMPASRLTALTRNTCCSIAFGTASSRMSSC